MSFGELRYVSYLIAPRAPTCLPISPAPRLIRVRQDVPFDAAK